MQVSPMPCPLQNAVRALGLRATSPIVNLIFRPTARRLSLRNGAGLRDRSGDFSKSMTDWIPLGGGLYPARFQARRRPTTRLGTYIQNGGT
ncbi:hypothetical protein R1flu_019494 [Riccia fluitans]|uniref:Uncharacterized protein n=1 Tax=Riccia fluitans TaxID=41844 RepID=A0ABD1ZKZ8_9MARC